MNIENPRVGERKKKVIRLLGETMNESFEMLTLKNASMC
jgi:hypothetical protein